MTENCLEIKGLCKSFPGFQLEQLNFTLPKGYIMGLVGPNGAGKTTTIQLILNMLEIGAGSVTVFGKDSVKFESDIKQDIGVVFGRSFYVESWTPKDTEHAVSGFYKDWRHEVFQSILERFSLPLNKKVGAFSRGMQLKLMLACAFSHNAKLLILDEPTSGLDPSARDEFLEIVQNYIQDGEHSVLFSTHISSDLERIADYITYISQGKLVYTGSTSDLLTSYRMIKGGLSDLTPELEKAVIGLRKTELGFDGLIRTGDWNEPATCILDGATIDDIIIRMSKGGFVK